MNGNGLFVKVCFGLVAANFDPCIFPNNQVKSSALSFENSVKPA